MAQIEVSLNAPEWTRFIDDLRDKSRLQKGLLTAARIVGFKEVVKHFKEKRNPDGSSWPPWSAAYRKQRARLAGRLASKRARKRAATEGRSLVSQERLLELTGNLRKSFSPSNIKERHGQVALFNAANYSGFHDEGTDRLPRRQFMWISEDGIELAGQIVLNNWAGE